MNDVHWKNAFTFVVPTNVSSYAKETKGVNTTQRDFVMKEATGFLLLILTLSLKPDIKKIVRLTAAQRKSKGALESYTNST